MKTKYLIDKLLNLQCRAMLRSSKEESYGSIYSETT